MLGRIARAGLALMLVAPVGCYNPPKPACGFICGSGGACPEDYTCGADQRCHLNGTSQVCAPADAALDAPPVDGPADAPPDAAPDAPPDAAIDAPPDAIPAD